MKYIYSIILIFILNGCKSYKNEQQKYINEDVIDHIEKIDLKDFNLIGNIKSVTELKPLSNISNRSKYRSPEFYAEFNKQGKLTYYASFSSINNDTLYYKRIYYTKNKIKIISSSDSIISIYDKKNNLIGTKKYVYNKKFASSYKRIYHYDKKNRLIEAKHYSQSRTRKDFELGDFLIFKYLDDKKLKYRVKLSSKDTILEKEYTIDKTGRALTDGERTLTYVQNKLIENSNKSLYTNTKVVYDYKDDMLINKTLYTNGNETLKEEYFYDTNNNLIKKIEYKNGIMVRQSMFNYNYDNNNNWTEKRIQFDKTDLTIVREIEYW